MGNYKTIAGLGIVAILFASCGTTKEIRRAKRFDRKTERLKDKFPEFVKRDTVDAVVTYSKPRTSVDFRFVPKPYPVSDTIYFENQDVRVWIWQDADTVRGIAICDTITITETVRIPCETMAPVRYVAMPIKWWQKALMWLGGLFLVHILLRLTAPKFFN